ncbi:chitinase domain-containing protein 1-like isoform X2 [Chenopodium quinoa]|uniref:chitinase domain-containing protein 1-like isoform X2 n=1 Tax=Chenopodium quinoa TaxID=63459 RepID=UPI000B786C5B|nr:chitinase domain-containing protein 1-like isoform X2 [Chenopodium quinoa]
MSSFLSFVFIDWCSISFVELEKLNQMLQEVGCFKRNSTGYDLAKRFCPKFTHLSLVWYDLKRNSAGYDLAKRFCPKFTHLSLVWYDLKSQGAKLVLEGRHNADIGWMSEMRLKGNAQVFLHSCILLPT